MNVPFWRYLFVETFIGGDCHRYYLEGPAPLVWLAAFVSTSGQDNLSVARWTHVRPPDWKSGHEVVRLCR